jgi:hypothetical protein
MKRYLYTLLLFFICTQAFPQQYGNEWINYSQSYYRIFVVEDGIYRIDSTTLANAGLNVSSLDPRNFQVFGRGELQHIYVKGESDHHFNSGDYIEFYGMHNDGWYDKNLFENPADQPNPNYSMFNDTATYYLTINPSYLAGTIGRMTALPAPTPSEILTYYPATFFNKVSRVDYTSTYYFGETYNDGITDPEYVKSEGWFDGGFTLGSSISRSIPTPNRFTSGNAIIDFQMIGGSNYSPLSPDHHMNITYAGVTIDELQEAYYAKHYFDTVAVSSLGTVSATNTTNFTFSSVNDLGDNNNPDRNTVAFINIKYPHNLDLGGESTFTFYTLNSAFTGQTKTRLDFTNFLANTGDSIKIWDLTNYKRIVVVKNGSTYQALVPNASGEKKCYLVSDSQVHNVASVIPVSYDPAHYAKFRDFTTPAVLRADYIIITHRSLWNEANAYSIYRASSPVASFDTLLVDINDLYDQFCYGIRKNPLAIKNFAKYAFDLFNDPPKDIFLIGKGYRAAESDANRCYRKNASVYSETLIPGLGTPPSDILFTKFDSTFKQWIPTGRLAARNSTHVSWYLNKVEEYENAQLTPQEWMKNILHFGGGTDIYQQNVLASYLNTYKAIIEGPYFGGFVRTFLKSSTDPIQTNQSDSLKTIINNGVSLLTFFGHGAGIGFDMSTDYPSAYDNHEKYPFLLALSCLAGDLYNSIPSSSEEFVLIEDKGSIGYLASVAKGQQSNLHQYADTLYHHWGIYDYGQPVGINIKKTIEGLNNANPTDFNVKTTCLEMTLHGDPAIKLNSFEKPDYVVTTPDIYFTPTDVTTNDSLFTINIISTNIGRAIDSSFILNITRLFPDGTTSILDTIVPATLFKDTFSIVLPVDLSRGVGLNTFTVTLDAQFWIDENLENNNTATTTLNITSNDITPVYPYEYAIVPSLNVTLKGSTGNPFAPAQDYIFEIDTTDEFNSSAKLSHAVNHSGGVVTWTPVLPVTTDSIVYFWRVSTDSTASHPYYKWKESSFQYITGKRGWGQAHFFQFKKDSYTYVKYNKPARKFEFQNDVKSIQAQTGYFLGDWWYDWKEEWLKLDGDMISQWFCPGWYSNSGAIKIAVFDSISGEPWVNPGVVDTCRGAFGQFNCQGYPTGAFDFYFSTDANRTTVKNFLNLIPQNDYVLVMTHQNHHCSLWDNSLITAFQSIGSSVADTTRIEDTRPYIILGKKGAMPGSVPEITGQPYGNLRLLSESITSKWNEGTVKSVVIGPAAKWDSLHWRVRSYDSKLTDSIKLNVIGIKTDGTEVPLIQNLLPVDSTLDISLWNRIDYALYPYIRLMAVTKDDTFNTPSQLVRWQVMFEEVPETALDPSINFMFYKDTLLEGDSVRFSTAIHNISDYDMDSLLVHYWIIDVNRMVHPVYYHRYRPHPSADTIIDTVAFSTTGLPGLNSLWIEANPSNDQPEQYHFNNIGSVNFFVDADRINPLLDVTFDGVHIMDNDIVSAKPLIEMRLKDENKFLLLNDLRDTSLFKIYIQKPGAATADRIFFKEQEVGEMIYYPTATNSDNKCRIELNAEFPIDGIYTLIVQATDKSKNSSGDNDYKIDFEVINKSTITEVMNWPNPFSTSTRFVFLLTGSEIPTYFKIQIMTITGKVVREIGMEDLGNIHIGRNITQYAWDGKDDFGDQLANGVYLYRVITNINGKNIDKNPTAADKYFTQEFGKMYLMR